jgi:hypothetical protein
MIFAEPRTAMLVTGIFYLSRKWRERDFECGRRRRVANLVH